LETPDERFGELLIYVESEAVPDLDPEEVAARAREVAHLL
jgi:hypothetical protein